MYCIKCPAYRYSCSEEFCVCYGSDFEIPEEKEKRNEFDDLIGCSLRLTQVKKIMIEKGWRLEEDGNK